MNIRPGIKNSALGVEAGAPGCVQPEGARLSLHLLGCFELARGGQKVAVPGKRERALLAYLALSPKGRQPRRKLAALLWGDATDETLLDNLRTCVWRLRKLLGDHAHRLLASDEDDIVLDLAAFDIDLLTLRHLCRKTGRAELEAAARLCSGEFLSGLELDSEDFECWRRIEASLYLDQAVDVLTRLIKLLVDNGESERAIETGTRLLGLDPLNEKVARHVMQLYAGSGRRGAAIQLYQSLSEALKKTLNTQPEAETRRLYAGLNQAGAECADMGGADHVAAIPDNNQAVAASPPPPLRPKRARGILGWPRSVAALAVIVTTVTALAAYWRIAPHSAALPAAPSHDFGAANGNAAGASRTPLTIAVLPFDNQTGNAGLQSFSDGLADEIAVALKLAPGLKLVPPAAAIQVTRETERRDIDVALGVRFLVEGDVRAAQNHVLVTAKLVRTDSGAAVWSKSYDRALNDISTVRTVTAMAIADAVKSPLGLSQDKPPLAAIDASSYAQFQRAQALMRTRFTGAKEAMDILEPLVKRNPSFAPAWGALAQCYAWMPSFLSPYDAPERRRRIQLFFPMAQQAAHRAIGLDPKLAQPYVALGHIEAFKGNWAAALDLVSKALALDPQSAAVLDNQMAMYAILGFRKKALAVGEQLAALDPDSVTSQQDVAEVRWENGQSDGAIGTLKALIDRPSGSTSLAMMYASVGRYKDAAGVLETALQGPGTLPQTWPESFRIAAGFLRQAPAKIALPPDPPHLDRVGFAYLYIGAPEHALDNYEDWIKSGQTGGQGNSFSYIWNDAYAPARKTIQFKQFARDAGLVAYWRARGWPDLCRPAAKDDFVCR